MISKYDLVANWLTVDFDDEIFYLQQRGGISRYFTELIRALREEDHLGIDPRLTFTRTRNEPLRASGLFPELREPIEMAKPIVRLAGKWRPTHDFARRRSVGHQPHKPASILHATYWAPRARDLKKHPKLAVSIMDLIPEMTGAVRFGGPFGGREKLLRQANVVFCISDTTRNDLLQRYPWIDVPVLTTPLAVDPIVFSARSSLKPARQVAPFPYILFVGTRAGYKNFETLVAAVGQVRAAGMDVGIVAAGPPAAAAEIESMGRLIHANRVKFLQPSDVELAELYRQAVMFVFPSLMEGFGLPILEAMSCGCPVVLSDIPVFREVAGDAAQYFAVGAAEALADAVIHILTSVEVRSQFVLSGQERADSFTWRKTAALTASGYRQACDA